MKIRKGFTLLELMLAVSLSSIVFLLAGSFMAFVVEKNSKNQKAEMFEQVRNDLFREFTNNIKWAKTVEITPSGLKTDSVNYVWTGEKIEKNGAVVVSDEVKISQFTVENFSLSPELVSLRITLGVQNARNPLSNDTFSLVVSQRMTEVSK